MKKLLTAVSGALFVWGIASGWALPVKIEFADLRDWGRLYSVDQNGDVHILNNNPYYSAYPSQSGDNGDWTGWGDGKEDSFGIVNVSEIIIDTDEDGSFNPYTDQVIYNMGRDNYEITMFYGGFDDVGIAPGSDATVYTYSVGGFAYMYRHDDNVYNPSLGPEARTGVTTYPGVTDGTLLLSGEGHLMFGDTLPYTMRNDFNYKSSIGNGNAYFDITGGLWADYFRDVPDYQGADLMVDFNSFPNSSNANWVVYSPYGESWAKGDMIPEPASLVLLGIGLGLAGLSRRRKA